MKRSHIFSLVAAASFVVTWPVVWFVLDVDLHLKKASATTSTAAPSNAVALEPFKTAHAPTRRQRGYLRWIGRGISLSGPPF